MSHARPYDSPPEPTDILGTVKCARWNAQENATLIRMARQMAFDGGYTAEGGSEVFERFHQIDLLLTCVMDRITADAEMLDQCETRLHSKVGKRAAG